VCAESSSLSLMANIPAIAQGGGYKQTQFISSGPQKFPQGDY